jgi:hypothetical protein
MQAWKKRDKPHIDSKISEIELGFRQQKKSRNKGYINQKIKELGQLDAHLK